ncbi:MAG: ABC transporter substrate-binding protein [Proteobacteria bacterium]|jgi:tripartite-type tricarboxylate transporter receptor subunit TctC|nr:MAG: ABC transporter substrate-binding protein [Pseudomonadota bacterium]
MEPRSRRLARTRLNKKSKTEGWEDDVNKRSVMRALAALLVLGAGAAHAETYPSRPITMVVPLPAGGPADILTRLVAEKLRGAFNQQVVVENRAGGAGGLVGTESVFRAAPDGYTLLVAPQLTFSVNHLLFPKQSFDTRNFAPVSVIARYPSVLLGRADLPANSTAELVGYARANPGKINYGSQGKGQIGHLTMELIKYLAKVDMVHVPYRGSAPALNDLLAGQIDVLPDLLLASKQHILAGKIKLLGVGSSERLAAFPAIPTLAEALPGAYSDTWMAVAAPPGTPAEITRMLSAAIGQGVRAPDASARITDLQAEPMGSTPDEMRELIRQSTERWGPVIEAAKITSE